MMMGATGVTRKSLFETGAQTLGGMSVKSGATALRQIQVEENEA